VEGGGEELEFASKEEGFVQRVKDFIRRGGSRENDPANHGIFTSLGAGAPSGEGERRLKGGGGRSEGRRGFSSEIVEARIFTFLIWGEIRGFGGGKGRLQGWRGGSLRGMWKVNKRGQRRVLLGGRIFSLFKKPKWKRQWALYGCELIWSRYVWQGRRERDVGKKGKEDRKGGLRGSFLVSNSKKKRGKFSTLNA